MAWWKFWEWTPPSADPPRKNARAVVPSYRDAETADASGDYAEQYETALRSWLGGYETEAQIQERICHDLAADEDHPLEEPALTELSTTLVHRAKAEAVRRADGFPETTDNDKLDAAFAALEKSGIVARDNFTCCLSCGGSEIGQQIDAAGEAGLAVRGYVFFHQQDTDSAVEGGGLLLAFGAVDERESATLAIGRETCEVLRSHGLTPVWADDPSKRIHVPMVWQRRPGAGYPQTSTLLARDG